MRRKKGKKKPILRKRRPDSQGSSLMGSSMGSSMGFTASKPSSMHKSGHRAIAEAEREDEIDDGFNNFDAKNASAAKFFSSRSSNVNNQDTTRQLRGQVTLRKVED